MYVNQACGHLPLLSGGHMLPFLFRTHNHNSEWGEDNGATVLCNNGSGPSGHATVGCRAIFLGLHPDVLFPFYDELILNLIVMDYPVFLLASQIESSPHG